MEKPSFTKKELRQLKRKARKIIWQSAKKRVFSKDRSDVKASDSQVIALIVAIFIPPLGVLIYQGSITTDFWLALLFWILGILPGIVYAWLVILDILTFA